MPTENVIKAGSYFDSVTLMLISSRMVEMAGVSNAAAMMGTDHNKALLDNSGLLTEEGRKATPNDLIIGVTAESPGVVQEAIQAVEAFLHQRQVQAGEEQDRVFRTLDTALGGLPGANLALISVPGRYAKLEAMKALNRGLHVFLFSDNVSLEDEIELKKTAVDRGLLLMGPDCGTAIINGVGLGFANRVRRGSIGLIAAAGTGLQEVSSLVHRKGEGISQAIGTGGRDLKEGVDGAMMLAGLEALAADPLTRVIVLISKPPSPQVARMVLDRAARSGKPVVVCFVGGKLPADQPPGLFAAATLEGAAAAAVELVRGGRPSAGLEDFKTSSLRLVSRESAGLKEEQRYLRGLFSGGTLAYEAMFLAGQILGGIFSNSPLRPELALNSVEISREHTILDLGDDIFTQGRPHPMIDPRTRNERIMAEARDPQTAVLLLDLVLGYGANENPAGALLPAIRQAKETAASQGRYLPVVVSVCGTEDDPQGYQGQVLLLEEAGVVVMASNAQASRAAALIAARQPGIKVGEGGLRSD